MGVVKIIHTFGEYLGFQPYLHAFAPNGHFMERGLSDVIPVRRAVFFHSDLTHGMRGIDVGSSSRPIMPRKLNHSDSPLKMTNLSE